MKPSQFTKWTLLVLGLFTSTFGLLTSSIGSQLQISSPCQNPTLTVGPDQASSLQQLIDQTPTGTIVHLKPGTYRVNLLITRSLTLCGEGPQQTILDGSSVGRPAIRIFSDKETIVVTVEALSITKGRADLSAGGISYGGLAKISLNHVKISGNQGHGMGAFVEDAKIQLILQDVEISDNGLTGLVAVAGASGIELDLQNVLIANNGYGGGFPFCNGLSLFTSSARYKLVNVRIIGNRCDGLSMAGTARGTIQNLEVLNNGGQGILFQGAITASITDLTVMGSRLGGISVYSGSTSIERESKETASPQLSFRRTKISNSARSGLRIEDASVVSLQETTIEGNGTASFCQQPRGLLDVLKTCSGLHVQDEAQVTLIDSSIRDNADWGVTVYLMKCGYDRDKFTGKVTLEGRNVIEGNNTAGNQKGEVCLP